MIPCCPSCNKFVIGSNRKHGKVYCPHCGTEIVVSIKNKYIFVFLFLLAFLPFIFSEYSYPIFNVHGYFITYFFLYLLGIPLCQDSCRPC